MQIYANEVATGAFSGNGKRNEVKEGHGLWEEVL